MADDPEVMGDEDIGELEVLLQVGEQVDHLSLDRDVECRDGFVGDHELGAERQRAGDPDPLPLAARELVRKAVVVLRREPNLLEKLLHLPLSLAPVADAVDRERRADDRPDPLARVQRGVGILEDNLQLPPQRAHPTPRELRDVLPVEDDPAVG